MKISRLVPIILAFFLLFSFHSISVSQIILGIAFLTWLITLVIDKKTPQFPAFFWALIAYSLMSLLSSAMSDNPTVSFKDSRELLLFLIVPLIYNGFQQEKEMKWANLAILVSGFVSILYSLFYFLFIAAPGERVAGFMGHYMTQAGLLLLFSTFALSMFFFSREKIRYLWGIGFALASVALILTLTRNAWIGLLVAAVVIFLLYKPKILIFLPIIAGLFYIASPQNVKRRALSIFSLKSYSNALRIEYLKAGIEIIKDYPVFGTGPNTVHVIFQRPQYKLSEEARNNVHLHNNIIQIAAERGLPTLLAWLIFLTWTFISLIKLIKNKDPALFPFAAAGLALVLALMAAGLFEYNWGDSEVTTLFLYMICIPFTLKHIRKAEE